MLEDLDLNSIADDRARDLMQQLFNRLEDVMGDRQAARAEIQRLRDEMARLKGEQGPPTIKPHTPPAPPKNHASAQERHTPKGWTKGWTTAHSSIDREVAVAVDRSHVPPDAVCKGYADVVGQDVLFHTDHILCHKEQCYSPSQHTTSLASLPTGSHGPCGPGVKSLVLALYDGAPMSEPKVAELLRHGGIAISAGPVANLLIKDHNGFHEEKAALYPAGLARSPWQHLDDTSPRVNGRNGDCPIVCPPLSTAYCTTEATDRLTILDVLTHHQPRRLLVHDAARGSLEVFGLSAVRRQQVEQLPGGGLMDEATLPALLEAHLPGVGPQQRQWILDATAVAAYHAVLEGPVVRLLVCDDAPQCTLVTEELGLCWVHDGRHDKQWIPSIPHHRARLEDFIACFWTSYAQLLTYREPPTPEEAARLEGEFETLFSTVTGSTALDERMTKTRAKKRCLLMVLAHPEIPWHNNPAELGARARVRKRDVSFGPRTRDGAKAWDTFMTLTETATKLGGSFYHSIHDRVSGAYRLSSLADLIAQRAKVLNLGASWNSS